MAENALVLSASYGKPGSMAEYALVLGANYGKPKLN